MSDYEPAGGHKEMSSILADQYIASSGEQGGGGEVAGSQPMSTAVHLELK